MQKLHKEFLFNLSIECNSIKSNYAQQISIELLISIFDIPVKKILGAFITYLCICVYIFLMLILYKDKKSVFVE